LVPEYPLATSLIRRFTTQL